jgi:uncharacterized SAM-binding protein YcdF (DUF218 family)
MKGTAHPLLVLLLAPLLLLVVAAQAFWSAWTAPALAAADAARFDDRVAALCPADALLVLGAAQYDGVPSPALARRLAGAARLFEAGCAPLVVVSGGGRAGDRTTEGATGVAWLGAHGLPSTALLAEARARTTVENLSYAAELLPGRRWLIVTDDLHTVRAAVVADRLGVSADVVGVSSGEGRLPYAVRETMALLAYRLGAFR